MLVEWGDGFGVITEFGRLLQLHLPKKDEVEP